MLHVLRCVMCVFRVVCVVCCVLCVVFGVNTFIAQAVSSSVAVMGLSR